MVDSPQYKRSSPINSVSNHRHIPQIAVNGNLQENFSPVNSPPKVQSDIRHPDVSENFRRALYDRLYGELKKSEDDVGSDSSSSDSSEFFGESTSNSLQTKSNLPTDYFQKISPHSSPNRQQSSHPTSLLSTSFRLERPMSSLPTRNRPSSFSAYSGRKENFSADEAPVDEFTKLCTSLSEEKASFESTYEKHLRKIAPVNDEKKGLIKELQGAAKLSNEYINSLTKKTIKLRSSQREFIAEGYRKDNISNLADEAKQKSQKIIDLFKPETDSSKSVAELSSEGKKLIAFLAEKISILLLLSPQDLKEFTSREIIPKLSTYPTQIFRDALTKDYSPLIMDICRDILKNKTTL